MVAWSKGVSDIVGTCRHRLGGGKEKGGGGGVGRVSKGFRIGLGFGQRRVEWSERIEWIGLECSGRVNDPILTTGRN